MFWKRSDLKPAAVPLREIVEHFNEAASDDENFPATIDPRIYHVQLILDYFGDLNGKRVLDVGCGKGRFARVLQDRYPAARIAAFDLAEAMLRHVPAGVGACAGSMTTLPFLSAAFDCVYATESLEHAVDIEAAVAEMCRVAKPGGRIVIIDKDARAWGRLKTPAWEKWFGRKELEKLLARHCSRVSSKPISYWEDVAPDGLFLAWMAER
ncbi:MAG TPA: class I SAM-dependent methyltransferase [Bryobacteraceae bacterium]|nr:class I SAM-dependent methyltransferase [Bryobacteraceae bacterium]